MQRTGFIDHIGLGVPDLAATKRYYDALMPILGLTEGLGPAQVSRSNYGPNGARGPQLFFYEVADASAYLRQGAGFHHIAFVVQSREIVRDAYRWACAQGAEILDPPRDFPRYGAH
jgi:catechol 2,3-dioxygenase-like lactoylglutathione lyase family enzyme